ncbi:MAG TPA: dephospho-CoA kinase, partial [Pyrinomonadaceae bacterium]|nr:dephospho-CoA kinase [Pyrinomonadaceae bacterium]
MLKVGLTGSIAVGKTFVIGVFKELGAHVLDADQTARDVVKPGTKGLRQIVDQFGENVLTDSGELDRPKMASIVFADEKKRKLLNSIIHPLVFEEQDKWLKEQERNDPNGVGIVDAALMIESGGYKRFDRIIVVWCEPEIQLKRLMLRDDLAVADAEKRIASQMRQEEKKRYADHLIDTSKGFEDTRSQVVTLFARLKEAAESAG